MDVDVAVIGLGAMGSASLWRLAERGVNAIGFEQFALAHDQGSSHGESRVTRTAYFEDPRYVPLIRKSFELWRELEAVSGQSVLTMTGMLSIGKPDTAVITGTLASVREYHLAHETLDAQEMLRRYPQHVVRQDEVAIYEDDAGVLRPERSIEAMVARARDLGATAVTETVVDSIDPRADGVYITANGETVRAGHVILAVGTWLPSFLPDLELPVIPSRQVLVWWPVKRPAEFAPNRFPVYIHADMGHNWYGFPTLDGSTIKMGVHHEGTPTTPQTVDRTTYPSDLNLPREFVTKYLRGVVPHVAQAKVCMYSNTPDLNFLVGVVPGNPRVSVLGGFSGHGFKFASVLGDIAADLATTGGTDYPIGLFALDRFSAVS